jgi:TDG/mug DNA glycosylase family protein
MPNKPQARPARPAFPRRAPRRLPWFNVPVIRIFHTFGPVADGRARVLILGTMPGVASLAAGQYYAHPRNLFWDLMGDFFGAGRDLPYRRRLAALRRAGVALWDVVAECERPGSLDADIRRERANDVAGLLRRCPRIEAVVFNGQLAARLFRRHARDLPRPVRLLTLPSTSPAHAARSLSEKRRRWRQGLVAAGIVFARPIP